MPQSPATGGQRRTAAETREHVLVVARDLFYWRGIHAVGVDTIAAEAGVAPTTLYRLFGSKDGLVGAYVEREADNHRHWFERALGDPDRSAQERLICLFDALTQLVAPEICRGCPFQMVLAETPRADRGAHRAAVEVKLWVHGRLRKLAAEHLGSDELGDPQADRLADQLMLIFEGAFATAASIGADGPPSKLGRIASELLRR